MNGKLVTIAIIVQSEEQEFKKALDTALFQTYDEIELFIVASKLSGKNTLYMNHLVKQDKRVRLIYLANGTQDALKKEAARQARGEYLLFLNGDDWIDTDYIEELLRKADLKQRETGMAIDIIQCGTLLVSEHKFLRVPFFEYDTLLKEREIMKETVEGSLLGNHIWNRLIRCTLLRKIKLDGQDSYEDICTLYRIADYAYAALEVSDYKYYKHTKESMQQLRINQMKTGSTPNFQNRLERVENYEKRYEEMKDAYPEYANQMLAAFLKEALQIAVIRTADKEEHRQYATRINRIIKKVWNREIIQTGLPLLGRKEQLILQHRFLGKMIYRKVRKLEKNNPEKYAKRNAKLDQMMEKLQQKEYQKISQNKKIDETYKTGKTGKTERVYIIGTPEYHNLGDHAIAYAEEQFVYRYMPDKQVIQVTEDEIVNNFKDFSKEIQKSDILLLQGGGNMGSEYAVQERIRSKIISEFPHNRIVIMPQTIYFKKTKESQHLISKMIQIYGQHRNLLLVAREEVSFSIMKSKFKKNKVVLCPDIVLSLSYEKIAATLMRPDQRRGALLLLRSDAEGVLNIEQLLKMKEVCAEYFQEVRMTETSISYAVTEAHREMELHRKWEEFTRVEMVITDRLHGMIFAAITKTPCIVLTNYNHKLSGSFQWLESLPYIRYCNRVECLKETLEFMKKNVSIASITTMPQTILQPYYQKLAAEIMEDGTKRRLNVQS